MQKSLYKGIVPTQFAAFSVAILGLVIAVIAGISYRAVSSLEEEATERNLTLLAQTSDLIDAKLEQIDRIATRLGRSSASVAFLEMGPLASGSPELATVIQAATELQEFRIQNDFVRAVYLYARRSGIIISSGTTYLSPETEYRYCIDYGGLDYEAFARRFLSGQAHMDFASAAPMLVDKDRVSAVICANALPIGTGAGGLGVALAAIDESRLEEFLGRLVGGGAGGAFVLDAKGAVLSSTGSPAAVALARGIDFSEFQGPRLVKSSGSEWLVSHASSRRYGLTFVSVLPRAVYFERIDRIRRAALLMSAAFAALALVLAYFLARRSAKPFFDIARVLEGGGKGRKGGTRSASGDGLWGAEHSRPSQDRYRRPHRREGPARGRFRAPPAGPSPNRSTRHPRRGLQGPGRSPLEAERRSTRPRGRGRLRCLRRLFLGDSPRLRRARRAAHAERVPWAGPRSALPRIGLSLRDRHRHARHPVPAARGRGLRDGARGLPLFLRAGVGLRPPPRHERARSQPRRDQCGLRLLAKAPRFRPRSHGERTANLRSGLGPGPSPRLSLFDRAGG